MRAGVSNPSSCGQCWLPNAGGSQLLVFGTSESAGIGDMRSLIPSSTSDPRVQQSERRLLA
eukprot:1926540-Pleurochrysis_carterae.AAC.1